MKKVLITGASRGIGKATAKEFAKSGHHVIINSRNISELKKTADELGKINEHISYYPCDVSDYNEVKKMFDSIGSVDVLVNNAGTAYLGLFNTMTPSDLRKIIDLDLISVLNCTHIAIQSMINKKSGSIINVSSMWGICGASCEAVYSAAKGGINAFTKALGKELAPSGIRVNAVACGVIDTKMNDCLVPEEKAALEEDIPLGRMGRPEEIAKTICFLAGEESSYITGEVIKIDGGFI
ncbi:MAG: 3-oxoacyl-ACP reductase FabG [Firmicutes bacterium]|nr:3-oxoacyl-ACP reductase FabG [Bacillota bacterium]